jgi:hypothetical protein
MLEGGRAGNALKTTHSDAVALPENGRLFSLC